MLTRFYSRTTALGTAILIFCTLFVPAYPAHSYDTHVSSKKQRMIQKYFPNGYISQRTPDLSRINANDPDQAVNATLDIMRVTMIQALLEHRWALKQLWGQEARSADLEPPDNLARTIKVASAMNPNKPSWVEKKITDWAAKKNAKHGMSRFAVPTEVYQALDPKRLSWLQQKSLWLDAQTDHTKDDVIEWKEWMALVMRKLIEVTVQARSIDAEIEVLADGSIFQHFHIKPQLEKMITTTKLVQYNHDYIALETPTLDRIDTSNALAFEIQSRIQLRNEILRNAPLDITSLHLQQEKWTSVSVKERKGRPFYQIFYDEYLGAYGFPDYETLKRYAAEVPSATRDEINTITQTIRPNHSRPATTITQLVTSVADSERDYFTKVLKSDEFDENHLYQFSWTGRIHHGVVENSLSNLSDQDVETVTQSASNLLRRFYERSLDVNTEKIIELATCAMTDANNPNTNDPLIVLAEFPALKDFANSALEIYQAEFAHVIWKHVDASQAVFHEKIESREQWRKVTMYITITLGAIAIIASILSVVGAPEGLAGISILGKVAISMRSVSLIAGAAATTLSLSGFTLYSMGTRNIARAFIEYYEAGSHMINTSTYENYVNMDELMIATILQEAIFAGIAIWAFFIFRAGIVGAHIAGGQMTVSQRILETLARRVREQRRMLSSGSGSLRVQALIRMELMLINSIRIARRSRQLGHYVRNTIPLDRIGNTEFGRKVLQLPFIRRAIDQGHRVRIPGELAEELKTPSKFTEFLHRTPPNMLVQVFAEKSIRGDDFEDELDIVLTNLLANSLFGGVSIKFQFSKTYNQNWYRKSWRERFMIEAGFSPAPNRKLLGKPFPWQIKAPKFDPSWDRFKQTLSPLHHPALLEYEGVTSVWERLTQGIILGTTSRLFSEVALASIIDKEDRSNINPQQFLSRATYDNVIYGPFIANALWNSLNNQMGNAAQNDARYNIIIVPVRMLAKYIMHSIYVTGQSAFNDSIKYMSNSNTQAEFMTIDTAKDILQASEAFMGLGIQEGETALYLNQDEEDGPAYIEDIAWDQPHPDIEYSKIDYIGSEFLEPELF